MSTTPDRPDPVDDPSPSDTSSPETSQSETSQSETSQSETSQSDTNPFETSQPETSHSDAQADEPFTSPPPSPPAPFSSEGPPDSPSQPPYPTAPQTPPPPPPPPPPSGSGGEYGPPAGYGQAPAAYGSTAATMAPLSPQEEKGWSLAAHLLVLVGGFLGPLIIWLVFKGRGPFLEHHAKESLNFQITVMIALTISAVLTILLVGIFLIFLLLPWMFIMPIIAAVKANNGEWYRYPLTLRLVK